MRIAKTTITLVLGAKLFHISIGLLSIQHHLFLHFYLVYKFVFRQLLALQL